MRQLLINVTLLFILSFLAGCAMMANNVTEIKLHSIEFVKANPFEQRFIVNLDIKNTTSQLLFARTLDYKIMVNGILIDSNEQFIWCDIPAFSTQQVSILVSTNLWGQLKPLVRTIKEQKGVNYYLSGKLTTGSLFSQKISYINYTNTLTPDLLPKDKLNEFRNKISYALKH